MILLSRTMKRVIICISNICGEETIKICNKRFVELVDAFKNVATNEQHKSLRGRKHIGSGKTKPWNDNDYRKWFNLRINEDVKIIESLFIDWIKNKYNIKIEEVGEIGEHVSLIMKELNLGVAKMLFGSKFKEILKNEKTISVIKKVEEANKRKFLEIKNRNKP